MTAPPADAIHDQLVTFVTTDYAGITRGRAIAASSYDAGQNQTIGWVPANMSLTPFDLIADPNPWGSLGDLRLRPDDNARYRLRPQGSPTDLDMVISGDILKSHWSIHSSIDDACVVGIFEKVPFDSLDDFQLRTPLWSVVSCRWSVFLYAGSCPFHL